MERITPRYCVTAPIPHGNAWWGIADTQSTVMPNFGVANISIHMPHAEREIHKLCDRLNGVEKWSD